jgi:hypothetical protein
MLTIIAELGGALHLFTPAAGMESQLAVVLGVLGLALPVAAVASLSLSASLDLEARSNTYAEVLESLATLRTRLENARSEREFHWVMLETEERLLGETADWAARRSYTGVA